MRALASLNRAARAGSADHARALASLAGRGRRCAVALYEASRGLPTGWGGDRAAARALGLLGARVSGGNGGIFAPAIRRLPQVFDWLRQLSCSEPARRAVKPLDHGEASNLAFEEGVEELGIVAEGHAAVRLAIRAEHVGVGEDAGATIHPAAIDGVEADGANAVKHSLAQSEVVEIRRRCPVHPHVHVARIVHEAAEAGMGLEAAAPRQVHGTRRDVVDRGAAVILDRDVIARWASPKLPPAGHSLRPL